MKIKAHYKRYMSNYEEDCKTISEAVSFLKNGLEEGNLFPDFITIDGVKVWNQEDFLIGQIYDSLDELIKKYEN